MRILVTGGAGFLGSHLCDRLLAEGHDVIAMDNLLTGTVDNIAHLAGNRRFHFIHHNVTNYIYLKGPLDAILHFASPASPVDYLELPIQTLKVGSLGTHNALGLAMAKGARFLLASTSEVYGDPLIHPQTEEYWGNVNPIGPRGVYDEAKRFAEAMTMAYQRSHGVDTRIVRIFNSVLADEMVLLFNSETAHLTTVEEYAHEIESDPILRPRRILVPAFDLHTGHVTLQQASAFIKHPALKKDAFLIKTRYGREIRVTGDHSVFRRNECGEPEAIPVRDLQVGDHVAITGRLPVVERDRTTVNIAQHLIRTQPSQRLWEAAIISPQLLPIICENRALIERVLARSGRFAGSHSPRNSIGCAYRKYRSNHFLPLYVFDQLQRSLALPWPADARVRLYQGGGHNTLPNEFVITNDLLWLLGLFVAEGTLAAYPEHGTYALQLCSHQAALEEATRIFVDTFGVKVGSVPPTLTQGPAIYVHSKQLCMVFSDLLGLHGLSAEKRIPAWIFQLPLSRFKYFLEGYRVGDGTHSLNQLGQKLNFVTVSKGLAYDLLYSLLRFGIVASLGKYTTRITNKNPDRTFDFYSITVPALSNFDILSWDQGVTQTLNAKRFGDLVWAKVKAVEPVQTSDFVYDFSVPECENFIAGSGVFAHNTYGPRMRLNDGRVVPNFVAQALKGEPLTVYGDGSQTRSFCFVSDLIEGIYRLLLSNEVEPVNIGNPTELTIREFAERINAITGNPGGVIFKPLPKDDPKQRKPDISKARRILSWEPRVPLQEGLEQTVAHFRERLQIDG